MHIELHSYLICLNVLNLILVFFLIPGGYRFLIVGRKGGYLGDRVPLPFLANYKFTSLFWAAINVVGALSPNVMLKIAVFLLTTFIANYFFIFLRFSNIGRGMGAPGYFTYFSNLIGLLLSISELSHQNFVKFWLAQSLTMLLGGIFFISGIYKLNSGYTFKDSYGINVGLCNEMWSYQPKIFSRIAPKSFIFRIAQLISTWFEICGGLLLITGYLAKFGSVFLIVMFIGCGLVVRLGLLVPQIVFCLLLPFVKMSVPSNRNTLFGDLVQFSSKDHNEKFLFVFTVSILLFVIGEFLTYLFFINQAKLYRIPGISKFNKLASLYSKYFGTILWRVFTPDITGFHINIYSVDSEELRLRVSNWSNWKCFRFRYVGEAITVSSIFTTLRYWPSNADLFQKRLVSYASTLRKNGVTRIEFDLSRVKLEKTSSSLELVTRFKVDFPTMQVSEISLNPNFDIRSPEKFSSIQPESKLGQYGDA